MVEKTVFTDSKEYDIRYTDQRDTAYLRSLLKLKGMLHWFPPSDDAELDNFIQIWMGFSRFNAALTATFKGKPIGMSTLFLMPYRKVAHHCMFQIIVDPEYQKRGVGRSLIRNLKHLAKTQFRQEFLYLEILDENPIIPLLKSLDFYEFAREERFVKEGDQYFPRIIMGAKLI